MRDRRVPEQLLDPVEDAATRSPACRPSRPRARPSRETRTTSLSGLSKPMSARDTSFRTIEVETLARQLRPRALEAVGAGLGGEADEHLTRSARGADRREDVVRRLELERPGALAARASRRAARTAGSRRPRRPSARRRRAAPARRPRARARRSSRPRPPRPSGRPDARVRDDRDDLGATSRGLVGERRAHAPRAPVAEEAHRVERLARAAGRDEDAAAGEAAARSAAAPRRSRRRSPTGSAMRPIPHSPSASGPSSGPTSTAPRAASVATFARVAGCSHMRTFIAGATTSGPGRGERALRHDVVGEAVRELREGVRRARRDAHERRDARRVEVRVAAVERRRVAQHRAPAERRERLRPRRTARPRASSRPARRGPPSGAGGRAHTPGMRRRRP